MRRVRAVGGRADRALPRSTRVKIAIATPAQAGPEWTPFITEFKWPDEIRLEIRRLLGEEDAAWDRAFADARVAGTQVTDDVFVLRGGALIPLLDLHHLDWLAHFALGDLLDRNDLGNSSGETA